MAGVSNITTRFVLATEDDLSMFNDDADPKNTKKTNILCCKLNENVCFGRWCANYRNNE